MYIILPDEIHGLDDLINKINPSLLGESIKNMKIFSTKVVLPKFNFEYTTILGPLLQKVRLFLKQYIFILVFSYLRLER